MAKSPLLALDSGSVRSNQSEAPLSPSASQRSSSTLGIGKKRKADFNSDVFERESVASSKGDPLATTLQMLRAAAGDGPGRSPSPPHDSAAAVYQPAVKVSMPGLTHVGESSCGFAAESSQPPQLGMRSALPRGGGGVDESAVDPPPPPPSLVAAATAPGEVELMDPLAAEDQPPQPEVG